MPTDLSGFDIERFDTAPISIYAVDTMTDKETVAQNRGRGKNPVRVRRVHSAARLVWVPTNHRFPTQRTVPSVQAVDGLAGAKVDAIAEDRGRRGYDPAITQETIGLHLIGRETLRRDRYDGVLAIDLEFPDQGSLGGVDRVKIAVPRPDKDDVANDRWRRANHVLGHEVPYWLERRDICRVY